jgi:hypothetical protein
MILPDTELQLPAVRIFAAATNALIGNATQTFNVTAAALGGFYAQPFRLPENYDRSREGRLYAFIANGAGVGPAAGNVQLEATRGISTGGTAPVDTVLTTLAAIPAAWPVNNWIYLELGSALLPFYPAASLPQFALCGIRLSRNGPAAADTWASTLGLVANLVLRYHRLCLQCTPC